MIVGIYVFFGLMIFLGLLGLIGNIIRIEKESKKELMEKLYKNGEIDEYTYKKFL